MNTPSKDRDEAEASALHAALERAADSNPELAADYCDLCCDLGRGPGAFPLSRRRRRRKCQVAAVRA